MSRVEFATELYAISQGQVCSGTFRCHWCGGPCKSNLHHNDKILEIGVKSTIPTMRPADPYICVGCWLYRRKKITVRFLGGLYKDGQSPINFSWWITEKGAWAIRPTDNVELYECLLEPPNKFSLSLLDNCNENHLQIATVNDVNEIKATTPLKFTINGSIYSYNVYELDEALKHGPEGKEPGVQALIKMFGQYPGYNPEPEVADKQPMRGKPKGSDQYKRDQQQAVRKVIRKSSQNDS